MTDFFRYDEMTWDAVAELPRDTPLVLPLGSDYDLSLLASQLRISDPDRAPARHSRLAGAAADWRSPKQSSFAYISNLLDSLRDDGFSQVYCLAPAGIDPQSFFIQGLSHFLFAPSTRNP